MVSLRPLQLALQVVEAHLQLADLVQARLLPAPSAPPARPAAPGGRPSSRAARSSRLASPGPPGWRGRAPPSSSGQRRAQLVDLDRLGVDLHPQPGGGLDRPGRWPCPSRNLAAMYQSEKRGRGDQRRVESAPCGAPRSGPSARAGSRSCPRPRSSPTKTCWNRRSKAGSFSIRSRCSSSDVVAPTSCPCSPPAPTSSLSMLPASIAPSAALGDGDRVELVDERDDLAVASP